MMAGVPAYADFAKFYDKIMGDRSALIERVRGYVRSYLPDAGSLLELGCGTGAVLAGLADGLQITGIDLSPEMLAAAVQSTDVLVVGHPYIDVWAAVKPSALGIGGWPRIPPGQPWKEGVLQALGWPPDTAGAWQRILRAVTSFADLEPEFLGRVEELIDFVTAQGSR